MSNILIIDDEKAIRKTLSEILSYEGYKIDEAGDGEEGLKKAREKEYDVILCDIKMPKIDGIEFLEKAKEANPDIPIIMISGHGTIETAVEAVKKGAYDYISKPPDLNRLLITIRNAMDKTTLVAEMLACERCIEVHVSDNDGQGDWHQVCAEPPWWHPLLPHIHPHAVVFSEGNHRRARNNHVH